MKVVLKSKIGGGKTGGGCEGLKKLFQASLLIVSKLHFLKMAVCC